MKIAPSTLLVTAAAALLVGCAREPVWTIDAKVQRAMGGVDPNVPDTSIAYKTSDGGRAVLWLEDKGSWLNDSDACRRRLVRFAAWHDGEPPEATGSVACAVSSADTLGMIWIDRKPRGRWASVQVPKGKPWLPFAQSFVREVMNEPLAAENLAKAENAGWRFDSSVLVTKYFGTVELPTRWFQEFEALGAPPDLGDASLMCKGHKGTLEFVETTPERLTKVGYLKYDGFDVPTIQDGITRIKSKRYHDHVAFLIRKGERIVVLVAWAKPDEAFVEEAEKLAELLKGLLNK